MSALKNIFSGEGPKINYTPGGFKTGGLSIGYGPGGYNVSRSDALNSDISGIQNAYGSLGDVLGGLRSQVSPGFNSLLQSRLTDLGNQQTAALGNLRQNLASRRILGSSFGNDTINRQNIDFQQQRDKTIAENMLQSIEASQRLAQQEYGARVSGYKTGLDQFNFEAGLAGQLTQGANQALADIAKAQAKLDAENQQGFGKFVGGLLGTVGGSILGPTGGAIGGYLGNKVGGWLNGTATSASPFGSASTNAIY